MTDLYPLKFTPIFKEKIWGGNKLEVYLKKNLNGMNHIGESWEISALEGNKTTVANGHLKGLIIDDLINRYGIRFLGENSMNQFGTTFPLLIKYIDANDDLSVQVHPDDNVAKQKHGSFGKTEMWYVLQSDKNARIINGFNTSISKKTYLKALNSNDIFSVLEQQKVKKGDAIFIPAGRVHALGKGVMVAEIQQASDVTYRIFDYNRKDKNGNVRELHIEQALDVIDFKKPEVLNTTYNLEKNKSNRLIYSDYFKTNILLVQGKITRAYKRLLSFKIYLIVEGNAVLKVNSNTWNLNMGDTILIPAEIEQLEIKSRNAKILEVFL